MGSVSKADSAALQLNLLYICVYVFQDHVLCGTRGERQGAKESNDKAPRWPCRGSVRQGDRAATWQKEPERDHLLTLSLICFYSHLSTPRVILNMVFLSRAALMASERAAICMCVCMCVPLLALVCIFVPDCLRLGPAILSSVRSVPNFSHC